MILTVAYEFTHGYGNHCLISYLQTSFSLSRSLTYYSLNPYPP